VIIVLQQGFGELITRGKFWRNMDVLLHAANKDIDSSQAKLKKNKSGKDFRSGSKASVLI